MTVTRRAALLAGTGASAGLALLAGRAYPDGARHAVRPLAQPLETGPLPADGVPDVSDVYRDERDWTISRMRMLKRLQIVRTPLLELQLPRGFEGMRLLLKNESIQPSGSHKHRLAEALFEHALANNWLHSDGPVVEASSGSTAISEAWFSRALGMKFIAVVPAGTTEEKKQAIRDLGGEIVEAPSADVSRRAQEVADERGGHFMDQFTYAERAYDWRSDNSLAGEMFASVDPRWFVMGAGTGGTSVSVGRYARYKGHRTRVCVTDPENSAFFPGWLHDNRAATASGSRIEGIGRPRVEPSFIFEVVNRMMRVPDAASIATMRVVADRLGIAPGGSTGTGVFGALEILRGMRARGERGSVVTLLCDSGSRYRTTYYNDAFLDAQGIDFRAWLPTVERFFTTGEWNPPVVRKTVAAAPRFQMWAR
jgi:cysteine synthase A